MRGSDYLLKENKMEAMEPFFTSGNKSRERIAFNPRVEIVDVIEKFFNPVNMAEFNPGVEIVVVIDTEFSRTLYKYSI